MSAAQDMAKTPLMVWLKRYVVNLPVALVLLALALRLQQGYETPVSTAAAIGRWLDTSPDIVIVIFAAGGVMALFAPSRWHLVSTTAPLFAYAVATFVHSRIADPNVVPDVAWIQQAFLAFFAAGWALFARPFPDEQLITLSSVEDESEDMRGHESPE